MKPSFRSRPGAPLRERFPRHVMKEAGRLGSSISERDLTNRRDCRSHPVITIDPDSALDFDDAFSLRKTNRGDWDLRIHIADVSHYVKPGSALDREARTRGNSTYLADRVIPMLPESLSNDLCSLLPGVNRLTKCVEILLSPEGRVLRTRFSPAVIRSRRRYTYQQAMAIISGKARNRLDRMIQDADQLARKLRARRLRSGSLEFSSPETCLRLDRQGRITSIEQVTNDRSHQLIEEFMLLANETVATRLTQLQRPTLHRVHEHPDPRRLQEFRNTLRLHRIPCGDLNDRKELQRLMERLDKSSAGPALRIGFLRTLPRARYTTHPLGHYGLAKEYYGHFTSPIRRYADLLVHRALFDSITTRPKELKKVATHLSSTERASSEAERDSKRSRLCAYLKSEARRDTPRIWTGLVTEVSHFGIFVDIEELGMSGLIPRRLLNKRTYGLDPARQQALNRRSNRLIKLGSHLRLTVARVDSTRHRIDFALAPGASLRRSGI